MISTNLPLSAPILPVTVFIDNQPTELLYAGAAPGMVQGVLQINARVPGTVSVGDGIQVMFKVGNYSSPNTVTLSVR
jgi:uncharacterized protein (TIGR03437 family)